MKGKREGNKGKPAKNRIRDLERLLKHKQKLGINSKELASLHELLSQKREEVLSSSHQNLCNVSAAMRKKRQKIRFVELVKIKRKLQQAQNRLSYLETDESSDDTKLQILRDEIVQLERNKTYNIEYPHNVLYRPLFTATRSKEAAMNVVNEPVGEKIKWDRRHEGVIATSHEDDFFHRGRF